MRKAYKILVGNPQVVDQLGDLSIDGITLKLL
jgi:hypothetical protein